MKKELIILGAALALAGCKPQGGTATSTDTDSGSSSSSSTTTVTTNASGGSIRGSGSVNGSGSASGTLKVETNQTQKPPGSSGNQTSP
jgi:hypothetical protein